ncbi:MAG: orotidine 5'-phosphate decarboxylase / HUMPS family protein [Pseudomonadota bacterium]
MIEKKDRSIILACDFDLDRIDEIIPRISQYGIVGGFKVGFYLGLKYGLPEVVRRIRKYSNKPIIYDHQKACTDIPDTGKLFVDACDSSGIDSIIYFPLTGPVTQEAWIKASIDKQMDLIVGAWLTHQGFAKSEKGVFDEESILSVFKLAAEMGVKSYVVPGTKPHAIEKIKNTIQDVLGDLSDVHFYVPGLIRQGGDISEVSKILPQNFHAIIGRGLYESENLEDSMLEFEKLMLI